MANNNMDSVLAIKATASASLWDFLLKNLRSRSYEREKAAEDGGLTGPTRWRFATAMQLRSEADQRGRTGR